LNKKDISYPVPGKNRRFPTESYSCKSEMMILVIDLMANVGMAQHRLDGYEELPLITMGSDQKGEKELLALHPHGWSAIEVLDYLVSPSIKVKEF